MIMMNMAFNTKVRQLNLSSYPELHQAHLTLYRIKFYLNRFYIIQFKLSRQNPSKFGMDSFIIVPSFNIVKYSKMSLYSGSKFSLILEVQIN